MLKFILDSDTISYCGCGLTVINLKQCMQVVDTYRAWIGLTIIIILLSIIIAIRQWLEYGEMVN